MFSAILFGSCLGAGFLPSSAEAQSLDELVEDARKFPDRVDRLKSQYLKPAVLESKFTLETRFNDARVAYLLEDYERASLLFADIIRSAEFEDFGSARKALYLLGESLYEQRNFLSAKKYYRRIVDRGEGAHYQDAIVRLLQIAARTGDYSGVSELYERFDNNRSMGPAVNYLRGKTLYEKGDSAKAIPFLKKAAGSDDWGNRARYFIGVCLADQGKYAEAQEVFQTLSEDIDPSDAQAREVLHLTYLAQGRIAYERRNIEQAINFYQKLPRDSEHFDRALYELTWVLVSRESYEAASRNADIFLYFSDSDPKYIPEIKILKADLLLRTGNYEEASVAYQDVVDQFKPIREEMASFLEEGRDVEKFFRQLVDKELEGDKSVYLPKTVQRWIDRGEQLGRARQMVRDVAELRKDLDRTRASIKQMKARISSGAVIESFPDLAEGMRVGIETDNQLVQLQRDLLQKEYELLREEMSASERERWKEMEDELASLEREYEKTPKTRDAVKQRKGQIEGRFSRLQEELDSVRYQLEGQRDQLESIEEYIRENYGGIEGLPERDRQEVRTLRENVRENIERLQRREKELRERVEVVRQKVGVGDEVTQKERDMRSRYRSAIQKRREYLQQFHGRLSGERRRSVERITEARNSLDVAHDRLQSFFNEMQRVVDKKAEELTQKVRREEKLLEEREKRLSRMMRRAKDEAAKAAMNDYLRVREKFDDIVMRGNIGLLDVAWRKKQDRTDELNQLRQNRRRELKQLQQSFEEVR